MRVLEGRSEPELPAEPLTRAVLVLRPARLAVPVLPPDPAEVLDLENDHREDGEQEQPRAHRPRIAPNRAGCNGLSGSPSRAQSPTPKRGRRRATAASNAAS